MLKTEGLKEYNTNAIDLINQIIENYFLMLPTAWKTLDEGKLLHSCVNFENEKCQQSFIMINDNIQMMYICILYSNIPKILILYFSVIKLRIFL